MRVRSVIVVVVAGLVCAFLLANWRLLAAPAHVNLVLGSFEAPLGAVLLALFVIITLALALQWSVRHGDLLDDHRRQSKELETQRILAQSAEASRFTELGTFIREELQKSDQRVTAALDALRGELRDTEHSIAATLGEMDDRLRRVTLRGGDGSAT